MKKFRGKNTYTHRPEDIEKPVGKTQTVQDQSLTVKELLNRHLQGLPVVQKSVAWAEEDNDFDDIDLEEFNRMEMDEKLRINEEQNLKVQKAKKEAIERKKRNSEPHGGEGLQP